MVLTLGLTSEWQPGNSLLELHLLKIIYNVPAEELPTSFCKQRNGLSRVPAGGGKYLMYPVATIPQVWVVRFGSTMRVLVWSSGPAMAGGPHAGLT